MTQHDFIIFEPIKSTGVLKINDDQINSGIVKSYGRGYSADNGTFIRNIDIALGSKITFTNYIAIDTNGDKTYITRGRDVIMVEDGNKVQE